MSVVNHIPPPVPSDGDWGEWISWANLLPQFTELGLECVELSLGSSVVRLPDGVWTPNPSGGVNGGVAVAAADQAMGIVAATSLAPDALPATATLNAEYLCPAIPPLLLKAHVTQSGSRLVFVSVEVERADGRLALRYSGTMAAQSIGSR